MFVIFKYGPYFFVHSEYQCMKITDVIICIISVRLCCSTNVLLHVNNRLVDAECVLHEHGIVEDESSNCLKW